MLLCGSAAVLCKLCRSPGNFLFLVSCLQSNSLNDSDNISRLNEDMIQIYHDLNSTQEKKSLFNKMSSNYLNLDFSNFHLRSQVREKISFKGTFQIHLCEGAS